MFRQTTIAVLLLFALCCSGCFGPKKADNFQVLDVSFEWAGNAGSLSSPNPEITIKNVPAGTAFLEIRMTDLDSPTFDHGGGVLAYDGTGVIPVGALKNYRGPEPPSTHRYVFRITALNADKSIALGEGKAMRKYP